MSPNAAALLVIALGAALASAQRMEYRYPGLGIRHMLEKPWIGGGPRPDWDRPPMEQELEELYRRMIAQRSDEGFRNYDDDYEAGVESEKRSAVATALNAGRRRRQPTPAIGKEATPYVGVGVLSDVGYFFDSLRGNLENLALLSPQQRTQLFHEPPTVVLAPSGGGGGRSGIRKLNALRPLKPSGNIRSYNRRSVVKNNGNYPRANHHDPGLLWTGLGR